MSAARIRWSGLAGAALGIAALTAASRLVGFVRTLVFARTVGATCLGDTYVTSNTVPNILFEVVAGGALASLVVPVLAGPLARGDRDEASRTASALLSWAIAMTVPLMVLGMLAARPIVELLIGSATSGCSRHDELVVGTRMLLVFMPQVVGYAICVVLTGVLQAHRRFFAPALAPLVSSLVVIAAYLLYRTMHQGSRLADVSLRAQLVLSVGTTLGVVALATPLLLPTLRLHLRLRPTLRFPHAVGSRVRRLALGGIATLAAQQASVAVVLRLAHGGRAGTLVLYNLAWSVFLVPWAVLAVPIATSVFPRLSTSAAHDDAVGYAQVASRATRMVVTVTFAAAAALAAAAVPIARVLALRAPGDSDTVALAWALAAFAPGLVGYGLVAHAGRALYARQSWRFASVAICSGWLAVIVADIALVQAFAPRWRAVALGLGNSVGMTVAGVALLAGLGRVTEGAALRGLGRSGLAAVAGSAVGLAVGLLVVAAAGRHGVALSVFTAVASVAAASAAGGAIALWLETPAQRASLRSQLSGFARGAADA